MEHFQREVIGRHWPVAILFLSCLTQLAFGQVDTATVNGEVADVSGARIPAAQVTLQETSTGVENKTTTNNSGLFLLPSVKPGQYRLCIAKEGFAGTTLAHLVLNVGDQKNLAITLKVGTASQSVTVDASGLTLNTTDGSVGTVIDRKFVENIPLNGRSFQSLILLTPGVVTNSPQSAGASAPGAVGEFSVNGQRTESNVYSVDGVSANTGGYIYGYGTPGTSGSLPASSALGTTQSLVSVDALQEFRVSSSSYSAEYGLSPGGQFSFTTRSGTNQVHGTAFDYLRNNFFDANDWFNDNLGKPATALRQNDFGGTLGGPVVVPRLYSGKNRTFFFFSYEGLRLTQPQAAQTNYVPSAALRQAAPAVLQPLLNAFPLATGPALANGLAQFIQTDSLPSHLDSTSIRVDQELTPKLKAFFRFSDTQSAKQTRNLASLTSISQSSYTNTIGITAQLTKQTVNDFRLNYTTNVGADSKSLDNFGGAMPVNLLSLQGLTESTASSVFELVFPGYATALQQFVTVQPQHAWNVVDSVTVNRGRQILKAGVDYRSTASRLQQNSPAVYSYFNSSAAVLSNLSYYSGTNVSARSYPKYTNLGLYVQDEIRITQRLGISLGMRWDVDPSPTQTSGTLPYIAVGPTASSPDLTLAPAGTRFWQTSHYNFAPRLGLAYQAHTSPGWETVIRAGGGVFFDSGQQASTEAFGSSPGQSASATYTNVSYPLSPKLVNLSILIPPAPQYYEAFYFPQQLQLPYTLQWNVAIEQALGKNQALTLSYVGSGGRRLLWQQTVLGGNSKLFKYVVDEGSGNTSDYAALQLQFQRTLSHGLQVLAAYNWAHSIDYGSQNLDFSQIRGNSDYDLRENFNAALTYDLPTIDSRKILNNVLGKWAVDSRFSARSGFPLILNGNEVSNPNGQYGYSGLDLVSGMPLYLHVQGIAGNRRINPDAFSLPATGQVGNAPRNFVRGFGTNQIDMAARRTFRLVEGVNLQFRAEAFNMLNHPNFGYIQPTYGNVQFGEATAMLNQSLGNLSPLYQQGGPRSMQFALKLVF